MEKDRFLKVYANLPLGLRNEVILVLEGQGPISWNVAFIEINNDTKLGAIIFQKLIDLDII
jgi:hypothetical protein